MAFSSRHNCIFAAACWLLLCSCSSVSEVIYTVPAHPTNYQRHCSAVLRHTLSYFPGKYTIRALSLPSEQLATQFHLLELNKISVAHMPTSRDLEKRFKAIRVPLFGGLLSFRVFLIRPEKQPLFDKVATVDDLKKYSYGQGKHWVDTKVLEFNGFTVRKGDSIRNMHSMLAKGRFDAMPRGLTQPFLELEKHSALQLTVENNIILQYTLPVYFFVQKDNIELAQDLQSGLNKAIEDGTLHRIIINEKGFLDALRRLNLPKRRIFRLDNPFIPEQTPLDDKRLWIDIAKLMSGLNDKAFRYTSGE